MLILLSVALGLVGQTGLGALGEVHELAEHPETILAHAPHMPPHEHSSDAASDDHEAGNLMHALVHHAHCGSHTAAIPADDLALPHLCGTAANPSANLTCQVFAAHSATPFRPPKAA